MRPESTLQLRICKYLDEKYPKIIYHSDLSAGMALPVWIAVMNKRFQSSNGLPDLYILEPSNGFHALFLEIKVEGTKIYLKDGKTLVANPRIREQASMLETLRGKGYKAEFACGFEEATNIINEYLNYGEQEDKAIICEPEWVHEFV